jgi:hypothetical protein
VGANVDARNLGHQNLALPLVREDRSHRPGDIGRRQRAGGDLVEQRLKAVMVHPIDERDANRRPRHRLCGLEPAETRANNDNAGRFGDRFAALRTPRSSRFLA